MAKKHVFIFFCRLQLFFFKFVACAVPTDKSHGRQMLNGYKSCSPYESGRSRRLIYMHYHDCVYSKNHLGFSIIRLGYQHSELHKSRSQRGAAPSPPPPRSKNKNKKTSIPKPWRHIYRALLSMNYIPTTIPQPPVTTLGFSLCARLRT